MATLQLKRTSGYNNRLRKFKVFVDGKEVGTLGNGEAKSFSVPPGKHLLQVKIDWCGSPEFPFEINEGDTGYFTTGSNKVLKLATPVAIVLLILDIILRKTIGFNYTIVFLLAFLLVFVYYITVGRNNYVQIERDNFWNN